MMNDLVIPEIEGLRVFATSPDDMRLAQKQLVAWCGVKADKARTELQEAEENYETARRNKWRSEPFRRQKVQLQKQIDFYEKIATAVNAGYYIIPPFPIDIFAIRTDRKTPYKGTSTYRWDRHEQSARALPAGEGRYVSNLPEIYQRKITLHDPDTSEEKSQMQYFAEHFQDVDFPFTAVKPEIIHATAAAMDAKIFDEIGSLPPSRRGGDPIIAGRIKHFRQREPITFFIAWWLHSEDLE